MTDKNLFEAIMTLDDLPKDDRLLTTLATVMKYGKVELKSDDKGQVYYQMHINELLEKDIPQEDIYKIRGNGWKIQGDLIVKYL